MPFFVASDPNCFINLSLEPLFLIKNAAPSPSAVIAILFIRIAFLCHLLVVVFLNRLTMPKLRDANRKMSKKFVPFGILLDIPRVSPYN